MLRRLPFVVSIFADKTKRGRMDQIDVTRNQFREVGLGTVHHIAA